MKLKNLLSLLVVGILAAWAWQHSANSIWSLLPHAAALEENPRVAAVEVRSNVLKDLPCFKCHIYERYTQEPSEGVFSHALHVQFGYHCNQCHSFHGHRQMVISTSLCTRCHEAVPKVTSR